MANDGFVKNRLVQYPNKQLPNKQTCIWPNKFGRHVNKCAEMVMKSKFILSSKSPQQRPPQGEQSPGRVDPRAVDDAMSCRAPPQSPELPMRLTASAKIRYIPDTHAHMRASSIEATAPIAGGTRARMGVGHRVRHRHLWAWPLEAPTIQERFKGGEKKSGVSRGAVD
jgi:hypothetical protein